MNSCKRESSQLVVSATTLILDIEGTTTSISFVKDVLFPYVRKHLEEFVKKLWGTTDFEKHVLVLRSQAKEDEDNKIEGVIVIPETGEQEALMKAVVDNVLWQMDNDRKTKSLKDLQGLIMEEGYKKGELKGHVYDDVEPTLRAWADKNKTVYIYSSGSVHAQKLLFGHSEKGDLLSFVKGHFDTTIGMKSDPQSYKNILKEISLSPSEVAFFTDVPKEARAAKEVGMTAILVSREGNAPLSDEDTKDFTVITSFEDIEFESNKKIKICDESNVSDNNKQVSTYSTSVVKDNKPKDPKVTTNEEVEKMEVDDSPIKEAATAKDVIDKDESKLACDLKKDKEDAKCDKNVNVVSKACTEQNKESVESSQNTVYEKSSKDISSKKEAVKPADEMIKVDENTEPDNQPKKTDVVNQEKNSNILNVETATLEKDNLQDKNKETVVENNETTKSDVIEDIATASDVIKVNLDTNKDTESEVQSGSSNNETLKAVEKVETKKEETDSSTNNKHDSFEKNANVKELTAEQPSDKDSLSDKLQEGKEGTKETDNVIKSVKVLEHDGNHDVDDNKKETPVNDEVLKSDVKKSELEEKQDSLTSKSLNGEIKERDSETNVPKKEVSVPEVNLDVGLSDTKSKKTSQQQNCNENGDANSKETLEVPCIKKAELNGDNSSKDELSSSGDSVNGKSSQESVNGKSSQDSVNGKSSQGDEESDNAETKAFKNKKADLSSSASVETVVEA